MNAKLIISFAGVLLGLTASAAPLTPGQAWQRVAADPAMRMKPGISNQQPKLLHTALDEKGMAAVYVFSGMDEGYMVVSADDCGAPLLGYADKGSFDENGIPPQMEWWLGEYSRQIEYARGKGLSASQEYQAEGRPAILPLLTTQWNQDAPYNNDCPQKSGRQTYTGCVATSMAQVMNYFEYPLKGSGSKKYTVGGIGSLSMIFSAKEFDWDNMLDRYIPGDYNDEQASAVAYLMKACGYSVEMNYGYDASGAISAMIPGAMIKYFDYDPNARNANRLQYSASEWEEMIYENLKNVGPVIYNGSSPLEGGHSFVCDGYDGNGYFHFNWGWGGSADGYFLLTALNPSSQGIGGMGGGFNFGQDVVLGLQKPTGQPVTVDDRYIVQYGALQAEAEGMKMSFKAVDWNPNGWTTASINTLKFSFGAEILPAAGGEATYVSANSPGNLSVSPGSYYTSSRVTPVVMFPSSLPDGSYKVTLCSKDLDDENAQWRAVVPPYGYPNYVMVSKSGETLDISNVEIATIKVDEARIDSELYTGYPVKLVMELSNPNTDTITRGFSMCLNADGKRQYVGDSKLITIAPGEKLTEEWVCSLTAMPGAVKPAAGKTKDFTLEIYDPETNIVYGVFGDVTMRTLRAKMNIRSRDLSIAGSSYVEPAEGERGYYMIGDPENMNIEQSIEVISGYFAYPVVATIYEENANNPGYLIQLEEVTFDEIPFIDSDSISTVSTVMNFYQSVDDKLYYLRSYYVKDNSKSKLDEIRFMVKKGAVESIAASDVSVILHRGEGTITAHSEDGLESMSVYSADGSLLGNGNAASDYESVVNLPAGFKGVVIVRIIEKSGKVSSGRYII